MLLFNFVLPNIRNTEFELQFHFMAFFSLYYHIAFSIVEQKKVLLNAICLYLSCMMFYGFKKLFFKDEYYEVK